MSFKPTWYLVIATALVVGACGTLATPVWEASTPIVVAQVNTPQPTPLPPTRTPEPPTQTSAPTPTLTVTPLPPTVAPSLLPPTAESMPANEGNSNGDAANGEVLFNTFQADAGFACATCHRPDSEERLIGPGLLNIGQRAETRVEGLSVAEYILTSIVNPGAYVVDSFPDGLMPQNWAEIYAEDEINDIIAYLLTLQ